MEYQKQKLRGGQFAVWLFAEKQQVTFAITAKVRGVITEDQFQQALDKIRVKYPPLLMRVNIEPDGLSYLIPDDSLEFPVHILERETAEMWINEVTKELVHPFDMHKEAPIRFIWLRGDGISEIIIVCPHAMADGYSAAYVMRDLLHFLGDPDADVEPMPQVPSMSEIIPDIPGKWKTILGAKIKAAAIKLQQNQATKKGENISIEEASSKLAYHLLPWKLTTDQTTALVARCRIEETTVHAALSVAFLRSFGELHGNGWNRKIQSPFDLRKRLTQPVGESFGLFVNLTEFFVECGPELDFWDVARTIKRGFIQHTGDLPIFKSMHDLIALMDAVAPIITVDSLMKHISPVEYDLSITNLGRLDFPLQYGSLQLESLYGPSLSGIPEEIVLGVITYGGQLCFSMTFTHLKLNVDQAEQIKNRAMDWLAEATGW